MTGKAQAKRKPGKAPSAGAQEDAPWYAAAIEGRDKAADEPARDRRGMCRCCRRKVTVNPEGVVRHHKGLFGGGRCPGTGQTPLTLLWEDESPRNDET